MPTPPPKPTTPAPDLSRDLDHNGIIDAADDRSRDLNRDGILDGADRQEKDLNRDNKIDGTDQTLKAGANQTQNAVGNTLGWTKTEEAWKRPETANTQQQSQSKKIGGP